MNCANWLAVIVGNGMNAGRLRMRKRTTKGIQIGSREAMKEFLSKITLGICALGNRTELMRQVCGNRRAGLTM